MMIYELTVQTNLIDDPFLWILQMSEGSIRDTKGTANRPVPLFTMQHTHMWHVLLLLLARSTLPRYKRNLCYSATG